MAAARTRTTDGRTDCGVNEARDMQMMVSNELRAKVFLQEEGGGSLSARIAAGFNGTVDQQGGRQCH